MGPGSVRPLADEANAGAVRFVVDRQPCCVRQLPHLGLAQLSNRKQGLSQGFCGNAVKKVALILGRVGGLEELRPQRRVPQPSVVAGGDPGGTQTVHVVQTDAELDFPIAEDIRVRGSACGVFAQE
jgi:hypothetical protein